MYVYILQGIWIGMLFGTFVQTIVLIIITLKTDWNKQVIDQSVIVFFCCVHRLFHQFDIYKPCVFRVCFFFFNRNDITFIVFYTDNLKPKIG